MAEPLSLKCARFKTIQVLTLADFCSFQTSAKRHKGSFVPVSLHLCPENHGDAKHFSGTGTLKDLRLGAVRTSLAASGSGTSVGKSTASSLLFFLVDAKLLLPEAGI